MHSEEWKTEYRQLFGGVCYKGEQRIATGAEKGYEGSNKVSHFKDGKYITNVLMEKNK